jgi:hypothetical protein
MTKKAFHKIADGLDEVLVIIANPGPYAGIGLGPTVTTITVVFMVK